MGKWGVLCSLLVTTASACVVSDPCYLSTGSAPNFYYFPSDGNVVVSAGQSIAQSFVVTDSNTVDVAVIEFAAERTTNANMVASLYTAANPTAPTSGTLISSAAVFDGNDYIIPMHTPNYVFATVTANTSYWLVLTAQNANIQVGTRSTAVYPGTLLISADGNTWTSIGDPNTRLSLSAMGPAGCG